jgi:lysophospholipase L1-like esterase
MLAGLLCGSAACKEPPTPPSCVDTNSCPSPVPAPTVTCAESVSLTTTSHTVTASMATYLSPSVTGGTQPVALVCTPESGSIFAKGSTPVMCLATDAIGRQATCSFAVTVEVPAPPIPKLLGTKFLAFGDSLTQGNNGCNDLDCDNLAAPQLIDVGYEYPTILQQLLAARYTLQTVQVIESGKGGETAAEGSYRLPVEMTRYQPDAVLIMEGVNEFFFDDSASQAAGSLRAQVQRAKAGGAKQVFLATLPPEIAGSRRAWGAPHLSDLNGRIRDIAAQEQVVLVDVFTALNTDVTRYISSQEAYGKCCSSDSGWADGLHLTRAGRVKLAETFFDAIKANFEEKSGSSAALRQKVPGVSNFRELPVGVVPRR